MRNLSLREYKRDNAAFGFAVDGEQEAAIARRTHINIGPNGLRCRIGDEQSKARFSREVGAVARRYRGGQCLGDIDISTGEFVYRATIPVDSYAEVMAAVRRREARRGRN